MPLSDNSTAVS